MVNLLKKSERRKPSKTVNFADDDRWRRIEEERAQEREEDEIETEVVAVEDGEDESSSTAAKSKAIVIQEALGAIPLSERQFYDAVTLKTVADAAAAAAVARQQGYVRQQVTAEAAKAAASTDVGSLITGRSDLSVGSRYPIYTSDWSRHGSIWSRVGSRSETEAEPTNLLNQL